jgi:hypothetical protein
MKKIFTLILLSFIGLSSVIGQSICTNDTIVSIANAQTSDGFRTVVYGSDIYAFGSQVSKYSTVSNSWSSLLNMPTVRGEVGVAEVNGIIYCLGGWSGSPSNKNEAYNISTNTWSTMANLPATTTGCFAVSLNNKVYIIGGTLGTTTTHFYEYNPSTNTYTTLANPSQSRMHAGLVAYNNKIYLVGGHYYNGSYNSSNKLDEYDPSLNTWASKANIPVSIQRTNGTIYDNKLYLFGGTTTTPTMTPLNSFYVYDFVSNTWTTMANLPFSRASFDPKTVNGLVYLIGGHINATTTTNLSYKYYCIFCSDTTVTQTQTIFVSDPNFQSLSPKTYYESTDSLTTSIGGCDSIVNRYTHYVFQANYCTDTIHLTVTDTLFINANLVSINPLIYQNTIKIYPNPTSDHITLDFGGNYSTMNGYTLKITNQLSQIVYTTLINSQSTTVDLSTWTGNGIYFVHLLDEQSNTIDIRKIVLQ